MSDISDMSGATRPKSNQMNADDLALGPKRFSVTAVQHFPNDPAKQPIWITVAEHPQPYKPCLSMRRILFAAWGTDGREWIGRRMMLFCDASVTFGKEVPGGIRISHLSNLSQAIAIPLTKARGRKEVYIVDPLPEDTPEEVYSAERFNANLPKWRELIRSGKWTAEGIIDKALERAPLTEEQTRIIEEEEMKIISALNPG